MYNTLETQTISGLQTIRQVNKCNSTMTLKPLKRTSGKGYNGLKNHYQTYVNGYKAEKGTKQAVFISST